MGDNGLDSTQRSDHAMSREGDHLHRLFEVMGDAVYLVSTSTGKILDCNEAAVQQTGYSKEELLGMDILADLSCGEPNIGLATLIEGLQNRSRIRFTQPKRRKDGSLYWDEVVIVPFENGAPSTHISVNRDITDQIQREKALRESESRYRGIFESTTDAILVFDRGGILVEANPNAYEMYGYAPGEFLGQSAERIIHPDFFHGFANFRSAIEREGIFVSRSINLRKDGSPFDVEVHGARFTFQGEPHLLSVVRNIKAQVLAETSLETARLKVEHLYEASSQLAVCEKVADVYRLTVDAAQQILKFDVCSLDIAEEGRLMVEAVSPGLASDISREIELDGPSVAAKTFRSKQPILFGSINEVFEDRPLIDAFPSGISLPIGSYGVFQVASKMMDAFAQEDVRLLELLLGHTSQAIERIHLQEELVRQANHDPLTGVCNRRYFNQVIERELSRSKRHTHPIGFLMIDVNRFKEINDRFGHQTGDKILQTVAALLSDSVRESDLVVRYGGDEFLVVLLETEDVTDAATRRITQAVAERNQANGLIPFPVTLSIGSAVWDPSGEEPLEVVLSRADQRMYAVKRRLQIQEKPASGSPE